MALHRTRGPRNQRQGPYETQPIVRAAVQVEGAAESGVLVERSAQHHDRHQLQEGLQLEAAFQGGLQGIVRRVSRSSASSSIFVIASSRGF